MYKEKPESKGHDGKVRFGALPVAPLERVTEKS